jgi:hypothetical protein
MTLERMADGFVAAVRLLDLQRAFEEHREAEGKN